MSSLSSGFSGFQIVGQAGKKYGLIKPQELQEKPKVKAPLPVFGVDEGESVQEALKREAEKKKNLKKVISEQDEILSSDPTAFDYDGVYDSMKIQEEKKLVEKKAETTVKRDPKYIQQMKAKVETRKREKEVIYDRVLQKEKEREEKEFGRTERFVTSSYKKQLMENQKWLEEEAKREAREIDVSKTGDMSAFYSGMLTKNVALGTAPSTATQHKNTIPSDQSKFTSTSPSTSSSTTSHVTQPVNGSDSAATVQPNTQTQLQPQAHIDADTKTTLSTNQMDNEAQNIRETSDLSKKRTLENSDSTATSISNAEKQEVSKFERRHDDAAIADAKARYLARKAKQQQDQPK